MLQPGSLLQNRYQIDRVLGEGGFGAVYLAHDQRLDKFVALKETTRLTSEALRQFEREARILARLDHPALPAVTDYFSEGGGFYLVMSYIEGEDLGDYLAHQPGSCITEDEALALLAPVLAALRYLHNQQPPIVHRDIKPQNIRCASDGRTYLVDFGIAKAYDPQQKTLTGARALTPGFAPLEQHDGTTDPRTDIYALGMTLYVLLTGRSYLPEASKRIKNDPLLPVRQCNPAVSPHIEHAVMKMVAVHAEDRFQSVAEVQEALRPPSTPAPPAPPSPLHAPTVTLPTASQPRVPRWLLGLLALLVPVLVVGMLVMSGAGGLPEMFAAAPTSTATSTATPLPPSPTALPTPTATPSPTVTPSLNATLNKITFDSERDGNYDIYVMDADGSNPTRLTDNQAHDEGPAWSPDGTRIAFQSYRDGNDNIYVMDADGSNPTRLTDDPAEDHVPAWSPDNTRIAFASTRDGDWNIYVMDADGSNPTRLTDDPAQDGGPTWSPDGTRIAFHSARDGNLNIYVMEADGSNPTRLTDDPAENWWPAWSPDGTRIAFQSYRDGNTDIYVMDANGSNQTQLTTDPDLDEMPAWSPDGTRIAFHSRRDWNTDIYVMDADGSNQTQLTTDPAWNGAPAWSP